MTMTFYEISFSTFGVRNVLVRVFEEYHLLSVMFLLLKEALIGYLLCTDKETKNTRTVLHEVLLLLLRDFE